jgi:hypothetical protein
VSHLNVVWCGEVFVSRDCTFNVVRESVGGTFDAGTGVDVGTSAGIVVCILLVPSCAVWRKNVMYLMVRVVCTGTVQVLYGVLPGIVLYGTGVWYCVWWNCSDRTVRERVS